MGAQETFCQMMQHPGEDVTVFASRLQGHAIIFGKLYTAQELKGKFVQDLAPGVGGFLTAFGPSHNDERFMAIVTQTADLAQDVISTSQHSTRKLSTSPAERRLLLHTIRVCRSRLLAITELE
jgi:hypothetical protein